MKRETRSTKGLTKRHGVIFTCLATHTIRIELGGDLSTDSFCVMSEKTHSMATLCE